jgi:hypothetical protein
MYNIREPSSAVRKKWRRRTEGLEAEDSVPGKLDRRQESAGSRLLPALGRATRTRAQKVRKIPRLKQPKEFSSDYVDDNEGG